MIAEDQLGCGVAGASTRADSQAHPAYLHIAVDAVGVDRHGGVTILQGLLEALERDERVRCVTLYCNSPARRTKDWPVTGPKVREVHPESASTLLGRLWWHRRRAIDSARRDGASHMLCLAGLCVSRGLRLTSYIQQALPLRDVKVPRFGIGRTIRYRVMRLLMRASCASAEHVVVQSRHMRDLVSLAGWARPERVTLCRPSVPDVERSSVTVTRHQSTVLYVGRDDPHKNFAAVIAAWRVLVETLPDVQLVATIPTSAKYADTPGLRLVGELTSAQLREWYSCATVMVCPSLIESFGLPLVEAMQYGLPIVAADRPYARELCGDAARYFDPRDAHKLSEALRAVLVQPMEGEAMAAAGAAQIALLNAEPGYRELVWMLCETS